MCRAGAVVCSGGSPGAKASTAEMAKKEGRVG
jgi:hypothetical protein